MNKRARILAWSALGIAGGWLLALGLRGFVATPLRAIDAQTAQLRGKLKAAQAERTEFTKAEAFLATLPARTFGPTPDVAAAEVGALLTGQIVQVGLREGDFTRIPVGERRLKGAVEIGWTVQGEGLIERVIDLLFLLDQETRLHRLEGLALSAGGQPGRVRVRFRFLTLLLNPAPPMAASEPVALAQLDAAARSRYDAITRRDLLRPYVRRPVEESTVATTEPAPPLGESPSDTFASLRDLKVVSLSSWAGQPEVHVRDAQAGRMRVLKPGDALSGIEVVAVDYRARSLPDKPGLLSFSRVILKENETFYAVECGQTLGERRPFGPEELPVDLRE